MSQWGVPDSGILRKNKADDNLDELLVFGYSCKLFRDNEKALYIDQGKHLIPWMGDEKLKIDRYDCRGALSGLKQYEASREGYDALRWLGLSESEKKLEELCDNERYYSLEINEEEEEMYKEESAKRQKTNAIGFNYDNPQPAEEPPKEGIPTVPEKEEEDEPYKPSPVLDVPVDINIPKTVKEYARIEKTALFVCRQGPQMEILIKAKQADNLQFSFLTVGDPLYKFYRHLLSAFKNGRYQPQCEKKQEESQPVTTTTGGTNESHHYLHPSLVSGSAKSEAPSPSANPPIPSVPYRPSADCAYSQLVNRIQGAGLAAAAQPADDLMSLEQQYHHYYYVQHFYEYWRHAVLSSEQGALYANLPTDFSQLDQNMQSYIHQMAWAQFVQQHQNHVQQVQTTANNNSYAQIVSNLNKDAVNPYKANVPQLPPAEPQKEPQNGSQEMKPIEAEENKGTKAKKPLMSLAAAYGSGSESDTESSDSEKSDEKEQREVYKVPTGETKTVIDKMADYVFKNGEEFEEIIRQKGDPRFAFLKDGDEYYKYYRGKLQQLRGEPEIKKPKTNSVKKSSKPKKVIAPVSFSIKKPKDEVPKEIVSALPVEDSSDDENYPNNAPKSPHSTTNDSLDVAPTKEPAAFKEVPTAHKIGVHIVTSLQQPKVAVLSEKREESPKRSRPNSPTKKRSVSPNESTSSPKKGKTSSSIDMFAVEVEGKKGTNGVLAMDDPILEMIEIEKEQISADKLSDAKEKVRQLERKRKAAMFLRLKSAETNQVKASSRQSSPNKSSSEDSVMIIRSRGSSREKSVSKKRRTRSRDRSRSESVRSGRSSRRSPSRSRRKDSRKHKKHRERNRSRSRERKDRKKSHKSKSSKTKRKSKRHRRSRSRSRVRSVSRNRSTSAQSHISLDSS